MQPQPAPVVFRSHFDSAGRFERLEVLEAPSLSLITPGLLDELAPRYRDEVDDDVLVFAPGVRYLLGEVHGSTGERLLHRLP